jgi:hypothetical protein
MKVILQVEIPNNVVKELKEMNSDCQECCFRDYFDDKYYCCKWLSYTPQILKTTKKKYCCLPKGKCYLADPIDSKVHFKSLNDMIKNNAK